MRFTRDPASVLLDGGARQLLTRAYAARAGEWVMTRLADPSPAHQAWAAREGLDNLMGPDRPTTDSGQRDNAHTRWGRAFVRALYYQHRNFGDQAGGLRRSRRNVPYALPLEIEWGRRVPARGIIPAGRALRVRIPYGGQTALRAVRSRPLAERIYDDAGSPAGRHADPGKLDW